MSSTRELAKKEFTQLNKTNKTMNSLL